MRTIFSIKWIFFVKVKPKSKFSHIQVILVSTMIYFFSNSPFHKKYKNLPFTFEIINAFNWALGKNLHML